MSITTTLSAEVLDLVEMSPIEDLLLELLPAKLVGVNVQSLIEDKQTFPLVLARSAGDWGEWEGDPRVLDAGQVEIHVFCDGINADQDAALLSQAVRTVLRDSLNVVVPGKGHLTRVQMVARPRRVSDWATASGPVQYADLPAGVQRYESVYNVSIRKPQDKPFPQQ